MRRYACRVSSPALAKRLPRVVACAATLWLRPVITVSACSAASSAKRASTATSRSRTSTRAVRICSCSTFSVRSREVMPLWICS